MYWNGWANVSCFRTRMKLSVTTVETRDGSDDGEMVTVLEAKFGLVELR